jgi:hypothetical protein
MEDIFAALNYGDQRKVQFAAFRLQGPTRDWWLRKKEEYAVEQKVWTWVDFLAKFKDRFIPRWVIERKEDEFHNLKQDSKSVGNYAAEFTRLSKYCPLLVQAEMDRVRRFVKGLRPELKRTLIGIAPPTFSAAVEISSRIEGEHLDQAKQKSKKRVRPSAHKRLFRK